MRWLNQLIRWIVGHRILYIPKPVEEWVLLIQFQTNSPSTTTFDPQIYAYSGDYKWDLGDGTIVTGDTVSHTYADATTKTVKLYGKGICDIYRVQFNGDHIVGSLDFTNEAFYGTQNWNVYQNSSLTSVTFPSSPSRDLNTIQVYSCNITGTLDISMFENLNAAQIWISGNSLLTGLTLPSSTTGTLSAFIMSSTGYSGALDLSVYDNLYTSTQLQIYSNNSLTGLTFASSVTGTINILDIYSNSSLTGTLDISMFESYTSNARITIYNNSLTGITPPTTATGTLNTLQISNESGITGALDLSAFDTFTTSANVYVYSLSVTSLTFASTITGTLRRLYVLNNTSISGTIDLSMFTSFYASGAYMGINQNSSAAGITLYNAISAKFINWNAYDSNGVFVSILNYTNLPKVNNCYIQVQGNGYNAAQVNQYLYELYQLVSGEGAGGDYTGRAIQIAGTNAAPDSTSGGYDGLTAKTNLQGKGFTVTTN